MFYFYIFETLDTVFKIFPSRFMKCFCFRFQTTYSSTSGKIIIDKCVVNDYHAFKIRPFTSTPPVYLLIENIQRCLCMFGIDYPLKKFPLHVHNNITDEKRQLKVIDIAGLPIGYVPQVFRHILDNGGKIYAEVTAQPVPSFHPYPEPNKEEDGVVLPWKYILANIDADNLLNEMKQMEFYCM